MPAWLMPYLYGASTGSVAGTLLAVKVWHYRFVDGQNDALAGEPDPAGPEQPGEICGHDGCTVRH